MKGKKNTHSRIVESLRSYAPGADISLVEKALAFAKEQHTGQVRSSGEPFVEHPIEVAYLASTLHMDATSLAAALLHDTIEDCDVTAEDLSREFSPEVAVIVEGVTKLTGMEDFSKEERQAESFRKMLLATSTDVRVILIKLCDRLHNMRTLEFQKEEKRYWTARETQEIYAPIANHLGMALLRSELDDLSLLYLRPEIYRMIKERLEKEAPERNQYITETCRLIEKAVKHDNGKVIVRGRVSSISSLWDRMERQNLAIEEISNALRFLILVPSVSDCYAALGQLHSEWKPVPTRFKDYIALPKTNQYQALHTTLIGPDGRRLDIQIRTESMNHVAEEGVVANWKYGEGVFSSGKYEVDLGWIADLVREQQLVATPDEFFQLVKGELSAPEVFVFTPKGDLIRLPYRSTVLDFAYAIHSAIGDHFFKARCNNMVVAMDHQLRSGDVVEVETSDNEHPRKEWLQIVQTARARGRIQVFLKAQERAKAFLAGFEIVRRDLEAAGLGLMDLEKAGKIKDAAKALGLKNEQALYAQVGYGRLNPARVLSALLPSAGQVIEEEVIDNEEPPLQRIFHRVAEETRKRFGVVVNGFESFPVRVGHCCAPVKDDRIVGIISRNRGVTVHMASCPQVLKSDSLRRVPVSWDKSATNQYQVWILVQAQDRPGLLAKMSAAVTDFNAAIITARIATSDVGRVLDCFELKVFNLAQLQKIIRAIEMIPGVTRVKRLAEELARKLEKDDNLD